MLGQIFTPPAVADLTLTLAAEDLAGQGRLLDPACGEGIFLERARARRLAIDGIEVDPALAARARRTGARVKVADFLSVGPRPDYAAVVGNPPYVRQEVLGREAKEQVAAIAASRRADLAIAFVVHGLAFLRPGGRLAFVLSQAALDADYAAVLRALLEREARLVAVVASPAERWFEDAALHGAVVVLEKRSGPGPPACFARLRVPVAEAAARVRTMADLEAVADVRRVPSEVTRTTAWGPYLRASSRWFEVVEAAGGALVPLGDVAEVRRGVTSGANAFFYPPPTSGIEPSFLVPVLRSPRGAARIHVDPAALPTRAFTCDLEASALPRGARAWVTAHAHLASRPTLASRSRWWSLGVRPARTFLVKAYDARFVQPFSPRPLLCDQRLYAIFPGSALDEELLAAILNGTLTALALESLGRASMGEGALEWSVADARRLPVLDPRRLGGPRRRAVLAAFRRLGGRPIGTATEEAGAADRRVLDEQLLGGTDLKPFVQELGGWLRDAVAERLARARRGTRAS